MSVYRVASRYAKSFMELSMEKSSLEEVAADMQLIAKVCAENRELLLLLRNPIVKFDKKIQILNLIFKDKINKLTLSYLDLMTKKGREELLPDITAEFIKQYNDYKKIEVAELFTPHVINNDLRLEFHSMVYKLTGKKTKLIEHIQDDLIGGFLLKIGDRQIDHSVSGKLNKIKKNFTNKTHISKI